MLFIANSSLEKSFGNHDQLGKNGSIRRRTQDTCSTFYSIIRSSIGVGQAYAYSNLQLEHPMRDDEEQLIASFRFSFVINSSMFGLMSVSLCPG